MIVVAKTKCKLIDQESNKSKPAPKKLSYGIEFVVRHSFRKYPA